MAETDLHLVLPPKRCCQRGPNMEEAASAKPKDEDFPMLNARTITRELEGTTKEDAVYSSALSVVPAFRFDETVAKVFPDMIRRSVPGYETTLDMIGVMTDGISPPLT